MTTSTDDLRGRAEARVMKQEDFRTHVVVYVLVNLLMWGIWFVNGAHTASIWPVFSAVGWGIGLGTHWWVTYGLNESRRESEIERELRRLRDESSDR